MPLTQDAIDRANVIAYQVFPWSVTEGRFLPAVYTAVPEDGHGIVETSSDGFTVYNLPQFNNLGKRDHYLIVRWDMNGPMDWMIQRDDSIECRARNRMYSEARGMIFNGPEKQYAELGQSRWILDRAITFGDWKRF